MGTAVIDVNGPTLDVKFLRENGQIDDYFTIVKPSLFQITGIRRVARNLILEWDSNPGRRYQIETSETLLPSSWIPLDGSLVADSARSSFTVAMGANEGGRFYRVVEQP